MSDARLVWREFRYERRAFLRDPQALFFSVGLPLLYVVIFVSLFGNEPIDFVYEAQPGPLKAHTLMLAGFVVDRGDLGDVLQPRGDPGRAARERHPEALSRHAPADLGIDRRPRRDLDRASESRSPERLLALGRVAYGIPVPLAGLPALLLVLLLVSAAFCCLAFAFTLVVGKAGAAVPLGTGVTLALYFLSGNFFIIEHQPAAAARHRRRVPGQAPQRRAPDAPEPERDRLADRMARPARDRRLGDRRTARRPPVVPLDGRPRRGLTVGSGACHVWWATRGAGSARRSTDS